MGEATKIRSIVSGSLNVGDVGLVVVIDLFDDGPRRFAWKRNLHGIRHRQPLTVSRFGGEGGHVRFIVIAMVFVVTKKIGLPIG